MLFGSQSPALPFWNNWLLLGLGIFSSHFRFSLERKQGAESCQRPQNSCPCSCTWGKLRLRERAGFPRTRKDWVAEGADVGPEVPLGFWVHPPIMKSPYLYPYVPQKRRARSKARVVTTRMSARTHMGSTSGQPGRKHEC